ncbi:MAG TPA: hotdog fold thioesterase [Sphingobacterium sp.]|nr:hotdog fold thioesterase [Sphingobacterium sp.]
MIWYKKYSLQDVNAILAKNMTSFLEITAVDISDNALVATMPVTDRVKQPYGLLHGGASVVLAESVGSVASALIVNLEKFMVVGMEINANHIRAVKDGIVTATCTPLHIGASSHVWEIKIRNEQDKLVCISRLTVAVLKKR